MTHSNTSGPAILENRAAQITKIQGLDLDSPDPSSNVGNSESNPPAKGCKIMRPRYGNKKVGLKTLTPDRNVEFQTNGSDIEFSLENNENAKDSTALETVDCFQLLKEGLGDNIEEVHKPSDALPSDTINEVSNNDAGNSKLQNESVDDIEEVIISDKSKKTSKFNKFVKNVKKKLSPLNTSIIKPSEAFPSDTIDKESSSNIDGDLNDSSFLPTVNSTLTSKDSTVLDNKEGKRKAKLSAKRRKKLTGQRAKEAKDAEEIVQERNRYR